MGCVGSKKGKAELGGRGGAGGAGAPIGRPLSRQDYYARHPGSRNKPHPDNEPPKLPDQAGARSEEEKQVLKVESVDLNITENANFHRTSKYELAQDREEEDGHHAAQLVIRRGQAFDVTLKFDRAFNKERDDIRLIFTVGNNPKESKGTKVTIILSHDDGPRTWGATICKQEDTTFTMRVVTPANCIVARWNLTFDVILKGGDAEKTFRYPKPQPIYILFNPWCIDDEVYFNDEESLQEYVLNDKGRIYRGTTKQISYKPWNFGQFEDFILECVMYLLDTSEMSWRCRGNPVEVSRKISALVNAPDDNGILVGNWSGDYAGGISPLAWCGSVAIIEQYWKTKKPVTFGQCWVFSGVTTTVCRALGIPARSVTNFASAHDCDGSITIDNHWSSEGEPMEELNEDSVWNFHVWNDVWMARTDLPSGYGGWQAIDSTPQETSNGVYCCGPSSLECIKNGLVKLHYDGPFIFAEVNADRLHWIQDKENWRTTKQTHSIGMHISTKNPNNNDRMDITHLYKFGEGTTAERTAVERAVREGSTRKDVYEMPIEDMAFDLVEKDQIMIGEPFDVTVTASNNSEAERTVKVTLTATVVFYTGVPVKVIKKETYSVKAPAGASGQVSLNVKPEEYLDKLVDMALIKISCMVRVIETNQFHCEADDFRLIKPDVTVEAPERVVQGQEYEIKMTFKNPMPRALTKCEFQVEGAGLQRPMKFKQPTIGPHAEATAITKLKARRVGEREIIASFDSKELADLTGTASVIVDPPESS